MSRRVLVVIGLLLTVSLAAFEATVVSTVLPTVIDDLGGVEHYSWVFSAYLLASTVTVPIYGKLADLYGRKPLVLFGIAVFLAGSVGCGLATSMTMLIVLRAIQGLGAGAMQPITLTILGDLFSIEQRARLQAAFGAVWAVAGLAGPLVGGLIVARMSWRWVFFMNLPLGALAAALVGGALQENVKHKAHKLDLAGAGLLTVAALALLSVSLWGLVVAGLLLVWFFRVERTAAEPIVSLRLFAERPIWVSCAANALIGAAMFALLTFVPLYVQNVLGKTPTQAGATIAPMIFGWPLASAASGRLVMRVGFRPLIRLGLAITASSALALAFLLGREDRVMAQAAMFAFGIGMGFANTALIIAVQTVVAWDQRGVATASVVFFRTMGGALAVGALGGWVALVMPLRTALQQIFWMIAALALLAALVGAWFPHVTPREQRASES